MAVSLPRLANASRVMQAGHLRDDSVWENEAQVHNGLNLLMDISSLMEDICSHLEATEHYIQARERSEGDAATSTPPTSDEYVPKR